MTLVNSQAGRAQRVLVSGSAVSPTGAPEAALLPI